MYFFKYLISYSRYLILYSRYLKSYLIVYIRFLFGIINSYMACHKVCTDAESERLSLDELQRAQRWIATCDFRPF